MWRILCITPSVPRVHIYRTQWLAHGIAICRHCSMSLFSSLRRSKLAPNRWHVKHDWEEWKHGAFVSNIKHARFCTGMPCVGRRDLVVPFSSPVWRLLAHTNKCAPFPTAAGGGRAVQLARLHAPTKRAIKLLDGCKCENGSLKNSRGDFSIRALNHISFKMLVAPLLY